MPPSRSEVVRLKGAWTVHAGIVPGTPELEFTRQWYYTASAYESDRQVPPEAPENEFTRLMKAAHDYALQLTDPARVNWVRVEFVWY